MGNQPGVAVEQAARPEQFVSQAYSDWEKQIETLLQTRPTTIKTVILPPGVELNDSRLAKGVVVSERKYMMPSGAYPEWPVESPFECDIDGRLLPPCWGHERTHAHYAIYPDCCFPELNCGYCQLHKKSHPEQLTTHVTSATDYVKSSESTD